MSWFIGGLMRNYNAMLLSVAALLATTSNVIVSPDALAKGKTTHRRASHAYLVPPPPAYAPSILPDMRRYQSANYTSSNSRVVDTEGQAIETKSAASNVRTYGSSNSQESKGVRVNKYVTNWNS